MPSLDLGPVVGPQGEQGATGAQGIRGEQGLPGPNQVTNSTATPLTGILTGNGSVVGVANIDEAPTADSTGFAQSGGTDKAIKGRVPMYGMGKNLLRNWYFAGGGSGKGILPVNQRGGSSYTSNSYTIDGWRNRTAGASVTLASDGVVLSKGSETKIDFFQILGTELVTLIYGKTVSLSILLGDGRFRYSTFAWGSSSTARITESDFVISAGGTPSYGTNFTTFFLRLSGGDLTVVAIKLELGTEPTLCHNEGTAEAPVWVLNEVPDYEYELYRCMTSNADPSDTYANKSLATRQDMTSIQATGTTNTTGAAIPAGAYFYLNGILHRAKTQIDQNATFTVNTNCEQATEGGLNDIGRSISTIAEVSGNTTIQGGGYYRIGYVVIFSVAIQASKNLVSGDQVCQGLPPVRANNPALRFYNNNSQTFGDAILVNTGVITLKSSVSNGQSIRLTGAYISGD